MKPKEQKMIAVYQETKDKMDEAKVHPRQSYNELILKLLENANK